MATLEEKTYVCPECGRGFATSRSLDGHRVWCGKDSSEHRRKISEANSNPSLQTRKKMSEAACNRGPISEETRRKMSVASYNPSPETRRKMSEAARNPSPETKQKLSEAQKKRFADPTNHPWYRKHFSIEHKQKLSEAHKGKYRGKDSPNWRGGISSDRDKWHSNGGKQWVTYIHKQSTCALCGYPVSFTSTWDAAHHVLPFSYTDFRSEPANGLLLCGDCHKAVHNSSDWYAWVLLNEIHWGDADNLPAFRDALAEAVATGKYYNAL